MKLSPPSAKQRAGISLSIQPWLLGLGLFTLLPATTARAFTTTANTNVTVLVSDYGYNPEHRKIVNYRGTNAVNSFTVKRAADGATVFTGPLAPVTGDFGACEQGDFSSVRTEGEYFIQIGNETSFRTFRIRPHLWDNLQQLSAWYYFGLRRIGEDNVMGNLGDCDGTHWDDARYNPAYGTGYRYIGTAWGDGDDFRIYPSASLVVAQYCALKETRPFWDNNDWIYSQVRWGLDGTLSFLDEDGLLHWRGRLGRTSRGKSAAHVPGSLKGRLCLPFYGGGSGRSPEPGKLVSEWHCWRVHGHRDDFRNGHLPGAVCYGGDERDHPGRQPHQSESFGGDEGNALSRPRESHEFELVHPKWR